jgi:hypothetical protein
LNRCCIEFHLILRFFQYISSSSETPIVFLYWLTRKNSKLQIFHEHYDDRAKFRISLLSNLDRNIRIDIPSLVEVIKTIKSLKSEELKADLAVITDIIKMIWQKKEILEHWCSCGIAKEKRHHELRQLMEYCIMLLSFSSKIL